MTHGVAQVITQLPGYDPQNLSAQQVTDFLARLVAPVLGTESVGIFDALGRVLADDLVSPINVPPHDNSAMDGYAFDGAALRSGAPLSLQMVGTVHAGAPWNGTLLPVQALRIMTGAVLPKGLDTVVPHELARVDGDRITVPPGAVARGDNRRALGEDLRAGACALRAGERIGPAALGLIASLGLSSVRVRRRLRVAFFSTGNEIQSLGEAGRAGAVYDSNRYTLFGLLTRLGVQLLDMGVVRDDPAQLEAALHQAAASADAIITSAGMSEGEADHTRAMLQKLASASGGVAFWRIAMRPGRPMAVARIGAEAGSSGALLFGLPGNPVAVMVTFLAFVRPALLRMMGDTANAPPRLRARSSEAMRKKPGRTEYQRGIVHTAADGSLEVATTGYQGSGVLRSMVQANGLIVLPHDHGDVAIGDLVDVMLFDGVL